MFMGYSFAAAVKWSTSLAKPKFQGLFLLGIGNNIRKVACFSGGFHAHVFCGRNSKHLATFYLRVRRLS